MVMLCFGNRDTKIVVVLLCGDGVIVIVRGYVALIGTIGVVVALLLRVVTEC